jgi:hypothetical protein
VDGVTEMGIGFVLRLRYVIDNVNDVSDEIKFFASVFPEACGRRIVQFNVVAQLSYREHR